MLYKIHPNILTYVVCFYVCYSTTVDCRVMFRSSSDFVDMSVTTSDPRFDIVAEDLGVCVKECAQFSECNSFTYNRITSDCQGYSNVFTVQSGKLGPSPGTQYYYNIDYTPSEDTTIRHTTTITTTTRKSGGGKNVKEQTTVSSQGELTSGETTVFLENRNPSTTLTSSQTELVTSEAGEITSKIASQTSSPISISGETASQVTATSEAETPQITTKSEIEESTSPTTSKTEESTSQITTASELEDTTSQFNIVSVAETTTFKIINASGMVDISNTTHQGIGETVQK